MKNNLAIIAILFLSINLAHAGGPWTQKKGVGYLKLSEWWIKYDQHFTDSGKLDPNITTAIYTTAFYGEYGITDRFTTVVYAPLFVRNLHNNEISSTTAEVTQVGEAINSLGDIDVSFKYGLTSPGAKFPISLTLTLGIPSGVTGKGDLGILQTGDGEFNQLLQIDAGTGFKLGGLNAYAAASVGVNNRTNGFSEEFRYGFEAGAGLLKDKLWIIGRLGGVESFNNGNRAIDASSTGIFADRAEYTSFGVEAAYYITRQFGISASFASAFRGRIIAAAPSYSVGVFLDLSK